MQATLQGLIPPRSVCRCHAWTKLFPPVPAPKSHIQDFAATVNYEVRGRSSRRAPPARVGPQGSPHGRRVSPRSPALWLQASRLADGFALNVPSRP